MKRGKRSTLRTEGSGYTRRSHLWAELKRLAPEKLAKLRYTKASTEELEPMVEELVDRGEVANHADLARLAHVTTARMTQVMSLLLLAQDIQVELLELGFKEAELPRDLGTAVRVAFWAYAQTEQARGQVWIRERIFRHLGPEWVACLSAS